MLKSLRPLSVIFFGCKQNLSDEGQGVTVLNAGGPGTGVSAGRKGCRDSVREPGDEA